jgi:hypothetical protein
MSTVQNIGQNTPTTAGVENVAIRANGAVVYWKTSDTSRGRLLGALDAVDLLELLPKQREPHAILRAALLQLCNANGTGDRKYIVVERKAPKVQGYQIHSVDKQDGQDSIVAFQGGYRLDEYENIVHDGDPQHQQAFDVPSVVAVYSYQQNIVPAATVGRVLVGAVQRIGGVCLRPAGGIYWVPEDVLLSIRALALVLNGANADCKVYIINTVLDDAAIDAVKDALVAEVTAITASIRQELVENKLGEQAVKHRKAQAKYLHERVSRYEGIFGEALDALHAAVNVTEQELKAAEAIDDNNEFFGDLYKAPENDHGSFGGILRGEEVSE